MPKLFIRLISPVVNNEDGPSLGAEWLLVENNGESRGQGVTDYRGLSELLDMGSDWMHDPDNIVVFLPTEYVLNINCTVPGKSVGHMRRALPFVVEEFSATDIEGMHLAHGSLRRNEPVTCNLVERNMLNDWLHCLGEIGLQPGYVHADAQSLPQARAQVSLLFNAGEVLIATEDQLACVDRGNLMVALGAVTLEADEDNPITILQINETLSDLEQTQMGSGVVFTEEGYSGGGLNYFAERWQSGLRGLNLLQGEFTPQRKANQTFARWRGVAALASVWFLLALVAMIGKGFWSSYQADLLAGETDQIYLNIFTNEKSVRDAVRQTKLKLGQGGSSSSNVITLIGLVATNMGARTQVNSFSYSDVRNELTADLMLPAITSLESLKSKLENNGASVTISSAEQQDNQTRARIKVQN